MTASVEERLAEVLDTHFDPVWGSTYWLDRAREMGLDPRAEIRSVSELAVLGPMRLEELSKRPIEDFVPRRFDGLQRSLMASETGGTTGAPARTAFLADEFHEAFVAPFVAAAEHVEFPRNVNWLFIGPSGPHAIGKAARECAHAMGSMDPFMVDFDPRWVRKLPPNSLAHRRYLQHVVNQTLDVFRSQSLGVLFATPPVLAELGQRLEASVRADVHGIHLGGLPSTPDFLVSLGQMFPHAVVLGGYGNSLAGMCPQLALTDDKQPDYFPHGARLALEVVEPDESGLGRVMFHRLDLTCFLPNVIERDVARRAELPLDAPNGFQMPGLRDPRPRADTTSGIHAALY